ncbi:MAG: hypothetical protein M3347_09740 [Armatimonadota bacterium]|nr:hypothetical protein [Armatimonadota bacterium]
MLCDSGLPMDAILIPVDSVSSEKWPSAKLESMSVKDIEHAITQLPVHELVELMSWLEEYHHQVWDQQIEDDLESGRLDSVLADVEKEYQAGLVQPL